MVKASFYDCNPEDEVNNNVALGESHALAMLYGVKVKDAPAVICQTIAACKPRESGYAVICDVSLSYPQHYNKHEKRQWVKDKAEGLEPYKRDLSKLAIEHIEEIKKIYRHCLGSYKAMSNYEREKAAALFRERMQERYGDVRQNAWTHETVYQVLLDRGERPKESQVDRYVTVYPQEKNSNCMLLYSPESKLYAKKPFHTNDSRPNWRQEVFDRLEGAVEWVSRDNKGPGKDKQNFEHYCVKDWTKFAEAVGLKSGNEGHQIESDSPVAQAGAGFGDPAENTLAEEPEEQGDFDPTDKEDGRRRIERAIVLRQGQPAFRKKLLKLYSGRCAITDCTVETVLEAAHIMPYKGNKTHHPSNGLLLRADIHTLFDRQLVSIDEGTMKLLVSSKLNGTEYENYRDKDVRIPKEKSCQPSREAIKQHRNESGRRVPLLACPASGTREISRPRIARIRPICNRCLQ